MEKLKKILKILPWALFIIAVTAIVAEVRYINIEKENYESYNKAIAETVAELQEEGDRLQEKATELQEKIVNLQGKADFYQEQIDSYEDKPNEWQGAVDDLSKRIKSVYSADKDALDAFAKDLFMKASDKIAKTDYSTFPEYPSAKMYGGYDEPFEITVDGFKYEMRHRWSFSWIEDEYYDIFTGKLLDKVFDKRFTEIEDDEGYLCFYVKEVEKGAKEWGVVNAELTRVSETDDEIKYSVKYDRQENGKITDKGLTCTMTIKYGEGRYRISDTDFGNL